MDFLLKSKSAVAFTGAGASQESGIPTFRDPGGIWDRFDPVEVGTSAGLLSLLKRDPDTLRNFAQDLVKTLDKAEPNPSHLCLSYLEKKGILRSVITQNVDDLHQRAGSKNVIELHGNFYRFRCLNCGFKEKKSKKYTIDKLKTLLEISEISIESIADILPKCKICGGIMRPDVVMFGEPVQELSRSFFEAKISDLFIIIGTSGLVYPAALLPRIAKEQGVPVVEVNPQGPFFDSLDNLFIKGPSGVVFEEVLNHLKRIN